MTKTELDLARRLAAHSKWRWMAGMRAVHDSDPRSYRLVFGAWALDDGPRFRSPMPTEGMTPDLSDAATQGCLWVMLREATNHLVRIETGGGDDIGAHVERLQRLNDADDTIETSSDSGSIGEAPARALLAAWDAQAEAERREGERT